MFTTSLSSFSSFLFPSCCFQSPISCFLTSTFFTSSFLLILLVISISLCSLTLPSLFPVRCYFAHTLFPLLFFFFHFPLIFLICKLFNLYHYNLSH
ncbi:MAG: hypothetical protein JOS17DRAFT_753487 [Linnemannia elongata]|nr:MAG: hypothetical protein JOS17DRAFT_753487 [Linnemannia elongata]